MVEVFWLFLDLKLSSNDGPNRISVPFRIERNTNLTDLLSELTTTTQNVLISTEKPCFEVYPGDRDHLNHCVESE